MKKTKLTPEQQVTMDALKGQVSLTSVVYILEDSGVNLHYEDGCYYDDNYDIRVFYEDDPREITISLSAANKHYTLVSITELSEYIPYILEYSRALEFRRDYGGERKHRALLDTVLSYLTDELDIWGLQISDNKQYGWPDFGDREISVKSIWDNYGSDYYYDEDNICITIARERDTAEFALPMTIDINGETYTITCREDITRYLELHREELLDIYGGYQEYCIECMDNEEEVA